MKNTKNINKSIDFGTAGIRGKVGYTAAHLSPAHVQRVAQGFAAYLLKKYRNKDKITVVIGRDNRRFSNKYSRLIAQILSSKPKFEIILSRKITPTPFVSFLVNRLKAQGAFNITASHNPKEYNGIKLYNEHGAQCLPEEIEQIKANFADYNTFSNDVKDLKWPIAHNIKDVSKKYWNEYVEYCLKIAQNTHFSIDKVKIAYSPLHGTGSVLAEQIFEKLGFKKDKDVFFVREQMLQDATFKTCPYPNPEKESAYELVEQVGLKNNCDLLMLTDPDADRVGIKVRHNNKYILLNGNETATLILDYLLRINTENLDDKYLVYSFVSSNLPEQIAKSYGLKSYVVPTGFKWIGHTIMQNKTQKMFYGFEESYGSLIDSSLVRDKDAIASIVSIVRMTQYYKDQGLDLIEALNQIYEKFGYVSSKTIDFEIDQNTDISVIQEKFIALEFENKHIKNYNNETDFMKANMIKIFFEDKNDWLALRPSGTEPKIKFYIFAYGSSAQESQEKLAKYIEKINKIF
ncbi:phospho-sugar mutase [Mycoplasmopsis mucosicanis]|uniref:phospho-sugar mutase n=1 Tax=Mycoplasmopsis mucosicanis TaxID=458208 RepID=UPI001F287DB0|nr:phospho-sugar mutase [Mycoplasmopsis mucosicanis]